jgi:hypothetical protein
MTRLLALFVLLAACAAQRPAPPPAPPCSPEAVQCAGEVLVLCDTTGAWVDVQRCPDVRPPAHCLASSDSARCVLDGPVQLATLTRELTPADVQSWAVWITRAADAALHNSLDPDSPIAVLNDHLAALGILERDAYRQHFAASIGRAIFAPFAPGVERGAWTLPGQVRVLGHETEHVTGRRSRGAT